LNGWNHTDLLYSFDEDGIVITNVSVSDDLSLDQVGDLAHIWGEIIMQSKFSIAHGRRKL